MTDQNAIRYPPPAFFFATLIIVYILMYGPFFFVQVIPPLFRIGVECFILVILMLLWMSKTQPGFVPLGFFLFPLLAFWRLNAGSTLAVNDSGEHGFPGFITKIAFLVLGVNSLQHRPFLVKFLAQAWALLWTIICLQVIFAAVGYYTGLVDFPYWGTLEGGINDYYFNRFFGYTQFRSYFGFLFAKVSGYLMEPLPLGFYTGLNILSASYFLTHRYAKKFKILNLIAGLASGSVAFFLFSSVWVAYYLFEKLLFRKKGIAFLVFATVGLWVSWILLIKMNVGNYSSLSERAFRLSIGLTALARSTTHALLFGNYNYGATVESDRGISCGLLNFFLERGLILFIPVMCLFYKYANRNFLLVAYLFYYSLLYEYFWCPAFVVFLVLFYCLSNEVRLAQPLQNRWPQGLGFSHPPLHHSL